MSRLDSFLAGVKVLDLSRHIPGPLASLLLVDMGAEVIKIEAPSGDDFEQMGPRGRDGRGVFYEVANAGKRVLRLDLKSASGRSAFLELAAEADILIEGFRPDVMARLGLDYPRLREVNRGLILCSISGYGATGPLREEAGHDANYLAAAGMLHRNGTTAPVLFDPPVADTSGSLFAAIAILGALHRQRQTGEGCRIDLGLADVAMPLQMFQAAAAVETGVSPGRGATYLNGGAAYYNLYATADGRHVALGAVEPKFWTNFCDAAARPQWRSRQNEAIPQVSLRNELAEFFAGLTLDECVRRFEGADCCLSPVLDLAEAVDTPHFRERGLLVRGADGLLQALFPVLVDGEAPAMRAPLERTDIADYGSSRAAKRDPSS